MGNEIFLLLLVVGLFLGLLTGFPVAFVLGGVSLLLAGAGTLLGVFETRLLFAIPQRVFGLMNNELLLVVPLFVFMGAMLERSGIAAELLDGIARAFGRRRAGMGYAIIIVGALLAASTGIVGATVTTLAMLAVPTMLKWGYSKKVVAGSICASGTLGQIIPPSLVLVLLADTVSSAYQKAQLDAGVFSPDTVTVGDLFAGAMVPGLILVGCYLLYQFGLSVFSPNSVPAAPETEQSETFGLHVLANRLFPPLALMIGVLGSILSGVATPTEAAAIGAVGAILLAGFGTAGRVRANLAFALFAAAVLLKMTALPALGITGRAAQIIVLVPVVPFLGLLTLACINLLRSGELSETCRTTAQLSAMIFMIVIGAAMLTLVFRGFGGDAVVRSLIDAAPGGPLGAVALVMLVMFLLGFLLDFIEIIFVIVPTVVPALLMAGIDPIWLAILISVNLQTSFLTPPFGFALFYFRAAAPAEIRTGDIYLGVLPFILIQAFVLLLVAFFPVLATGLPLALR